jgi:hypothetical protein
MNPELSDRMLDILFGCGDTIRELISFEMHFSAKTHPVVKDDIAVLEDLLPDLYLRSLQLIYSIQRSCTDVKRNFESRKEELVNWLKIRGRFTQITDGWGLEVSYLAYPEVLVVLLERSVTSHLVVTTRRGPPS